MDQYMPKMILQPLVENAVFHGLEPKEESGNVSVFVGKEKDRLAIRVQDSGCGMDEKELEALQVKLKEYDRTSLLPLQKSWNWNGEYLSQVTIVLREPSQSLM